MLDNEAMASVQLRDRAPMALARANWQSLLDPAISLAHEGFSVSACMAGSIANDAERLSTYLAASILDGLFYG